MERANPAEGNQEDCLVKAGFLDAAAHCFLALLFTGLTRAEIAVSDGEIDCKGARKACGFVYDQGGKRVCFAGGEGFQAVGSS